MLRSYADEVIQMRTIGPLTDGAGNEIPASIRDLVDCPRVAAQSDNAGM